MEINKDLKKKPVEPIDTDSASDVYILDEMWMKWKWSFMNGLKCEISEKEIENVVMCERAIICYSTHFDHCYFQQLNAYLMFSTFMWLMWTVFLVDDALTNTPVTAAVIQVLLPFF